MSRKEFSGKVYDIVVGVDHVTSAFVQLWNKPMDDQDGALIVIDSGGVRCAVDKTELPGKLSRCIDTFERRFAAAKNIGIHKPNLAADDVVVFIAAADESDAVPKREVYDIFD